jgi:hypothetical protein
LYLLHVVGGVVGGVDHLETALGSLAGFDELVGVLLADIRWQGFELVVGDGPVRGQSRNIEAVLDALEKGGVEITVDGVRRMEKKGKPR